MCLLHYIQNEVREKRNSKQYGFLVLLNMASSAAERELRGKVLLVLLSFHTEKETKSQSGPTQTIHPIRGARLYLSPEGLEVMTQSKYSLAAMESSTLFTSLVKLPSTCLLVACDLSAYTGTQCKQGPWRVGINPPPHNGDVETCHPRCNDRRYSSRKRTTAVAVCVSRLVAQ